MEFLGKAHASIKNTAQTPFDIKAQLSHQVRSTNSMEVVEWQAVSVQHLVCPVARRIDVECTGIHSAFISPHTIPPLCDPSLPCDSSCAASSSPFPRNTTIIAGDVYSRATSPATSPHPPLFAAVFNCPEGVHTLAGACCEGTVSDVVFTCCVSIHSVQS